MFWVSEISNNESSLNYCINIHTCIYVVDLKNNINSFVVSGNSVNCVGGPLLPKLLLDWPSMNQAVRPSSEHRRRNARQFSPPISQTYNGTAQGSCPPDNNLDHQQPICTRHYSATQAREHFGGGESEPRRSSKFSWKPDQRPLWHKWRSLVKKFKFFGWYFDKKKAYCYYYIEQASLPLWVR